MADVAPLPFTNYGASIASQENTAANTGYVGQQTQGAALQNANAALSYQLRRNAIANLSGQGGTTPDMAMSGSSDNSGTQDDLGVSAVTQAAGDAAVRNRYFVNPAGTQQEQNFIAQAALSGDEGLLKMATAQRDNNVITRTSLAQRDAGNHYDTAVSVVDAPDGRAMQILAATAPEAAAKMEKLYPDDSPEEADERARDTAAHMAGVIHQFTGRPLEKREDGVYVDKVSGLPVTGVPISGMSQTQYEQAWKEANTLVPVKQSDGTEAQVPQYKVAGFANAANYIATGAAKAKALQSMPTHPAFAGTPMAEPGTPAQSLARMRASGHPAFQPGAPGGVPNGAGPGAGVQSAQPGQPGTAPGQPTAQRDNGLLPGVDPDALPKVQLPPTRAGVSQSPTDAANVKMISDERASQLKSASEGAADAAKTRSLISQASAELSRVDPRTVGPGSATYNALLGMKTAITGQPPNALVDEVTLDKFLNQLGAQNVRQLLQGQRITNQEMMTFLTRGSPSTAQPLTAIKGLVGYLAADNDYESRLQQTKITALQRGADPFQLNSALEGAAPRATYVQQRTGVTTPRTTGQQTGPVRVTSPDQARALKPGTQFVTPDGRTLVR